MKLRQLLSRQQSEDSFMPRKHVPWIDTPLDTHAHGGHDPHAHHGGSKAKIRENSQHMLNHDMSHDASSDEHHPEKNHYHDDNPKFKKHHEASSIELFYDLFFVANLATFTANAEIADSHTLASYLGFFSLMWFTWLQTSLFDVRFGTESVFSRICKACSFGIMTGFAIVGPEFRTYEVEKSTRAFRATSLILMASRLILMLQYGVVLYYLKPYWKKTFIPLAVIIITLFITAMIFLGLFFGFKEDEKSRAYIGWYVMLGIEAIVTIATSTIWRIIGFKHTHLVERVGLLTLITMGEGIIGMTKAVTYIMKGSTELSASVIGMIICSVLIIYFLWMLYFDQIEHERFGSIRQQIWALLHFPLHICILLTVEGITQFMQWWIAYTNSHWALVRIGDAWQTSDTGDVLTARIHDNLDAIQTRFKDNAELPDFSKQFKAMSNYTNTESENERVGEIILDMSLTIFNWACGIYGIKPLEKNIKDSYEKYWAIVLIFRVVFIFFFACAGGVLMVLAIMYWFGKSHKSRGEWASIFVRFLIGLALTLLSIISHDYASEGKSNFASFIQSPWILPTVVFAYGLVIVIDNLLVWWSNRRLAIHGRQTIGRAISYHNGEA